MRESGGGAGKLNRTRSIGEKPVTGGPKPRPSGGSPRANGNRPSPGRPGSFQESAGGGAGGPGLRPSPRGPPGPPRNSNSPVSPRSPRLSGGGAGSSNNLTGSSGGSSPIKSATPEEARTEVGALLRECRLEEFTHKLVSVERFVLLSDMRALSPSAFDDLAIKVGLKLGQSRKLKKRLG